MSTPKCDAAIKAAEEASQDTSQESENFLLRALLAKAQEDQRWCDGARIKAYAERERWHGKFAIVIAENNALRKANRALRVQISNLQIEQASREASRKPPEEEPLF